ncbi:G-protein coupled receptor Mth2 [Bactrocera dorsalis]|uniref:G-protein coupled receptor Mth2 n=1 Tax=Bactrocera dorsalis TaxID=27457 RepID=A0ABM3JX03_BACDO|nr:G-protein coupled receptor Mth2 [Bactrocera dorsalis]
MIAAPLASSNAFYFFLSTVSLHFAIAEIPHCAFEDTVNLTGSQILPTGFYNYEGLAVPPHLTGFYEHIELFGGKRKVVAEHLRGCVCQLKRCVKFCCHPRADMYRSTETLRVECDDQLNEELTYSPFLNITLNNGKRISMHVMDEFVVQQGLPCDLGYMSMPHLRKEHQWELFENGSLLRFGDQLLISRRDYCLTAYPVGNHFVLNPMNCDAGQKISASLMLNTMIMLISLPFLYATILIFWLIPGLRNLNTKCLISYQFSLAIGNTMIIVTNLRKSDYDKTVCAAVGESVYFLDLIITLLIKLIEYITTNFSVKMRSRHLMVFFVIYLLNCHGVLSNIPNCAFEDTVNITAGQKFPNGTYSYEDLLVPSHLIGYYTYIELFGGERKPVEQHLRGCVCQLKRCIKFCCDPRAEMHRLDENSPAKCEPILIGGINYSPYLNITLHNGTQRAMNWLNEFVVQRGLPCENGQMLAPHVSDLERWELFENGSLLIADRPFISRRDYCLYAYPVYGINVLNPMDCFPYTEEKPPTIIANTIILMISAPFLYATIIILWLMGKLRNLHGKCLACYLFSLANGTLLLVVVNLRNSKYDDVACATIGFVNYYILTAVFFWLNVICFDLWKNFRITNVSIQLSTERKQFLYYSLYAWGLPAIMTAITVTLQYSDLPDELKSGIGVLRCWLNTDNWSAMIYFYGPCLLLIVFNIVFFFLTTKKILTTRRELRKLTRDDCRMQRLHSQQNNVWLFFRLFTIMGISWLLEIFTYLAGDREEYIVICAIINAFNSAQGLIIFIILILREKNLSVINNAIIANFSKLRCCRPVSHK